MKTLILSLALSLLLMTGNSQNVGIGTIAPTDQLHTTGTVRFQNYNGVGKRLVQIDSVGRLIVTSDGAIYSNLYPGAIPDNGCATNSGMTSTIIVSGQPTPVPSSKISVQVNISHTFDADLKIFLISPGGDI